MRFPPRAVLGGLLLLLPAPSAAQTVWTVGQPSGADFTEIQDAVDAASSGDTILVRTGFYGRFEIDGKGLCIAAEEGSTPTLQDTPPEGGALIAVRNLAAGQAVTIRGLTAFLGQVFHPSVYGIDLADDLGPVWIEDVEVTMFHPFVQEYGSLHALRVRDSVSVVVVDADLFGHRSSQGLDAEGSNVFAFGTRFRGGPGAFDPFAPLNFDGGHGARVVGGQLFASGCTFLGGAGVGPALLDCSVGPSDGGDGVHLGGGAPRFDYVDSELGGGAGGAHQFCAALPDGQPGAPVVAETGTVAPVAGLARSIASPATVREGEPQTLAFAGQPGELFFMAFSTKTVPGLALPPFLGVLVLGQPQVALFLGTLDGAGAGQVTLQLGELGPGVGAVSAYYLPAFFDPSTFAIAIGAPTAAVLVDAAVPSGP